MKREWSPKKAAGRSKQEVNTDGKQKSEATNEVPPSEQPSTSSQSEKLKRLKKMEEGSESESEVSSSSESKEEGDNLPSVPSVSLATDHLEVTVRVNHFPPGTESRVIKVEVYTETYARLNGSPRLIEARTTRFHHQEPLDRPVQGR